MNEFLPTELLLHEIMPYLGRTGRLLQLARLARTCRYFYHDGTWRRHATVLTQYIEWTPQHFAPFAPYVETMIWFLDATKYIYSNTLEFRLCPRLGALQLACVQPILANAPLASHFLPLAVDVLYFGPNFPWRLMFNYNACVEVKKAGHVQSLVPLAPEWKHDLRDLGVPFPFGSVMSSNPRKRIRTYRNDIVTHNILFNYVKFTH